MPCSNPDFGAEAHQWVAALLDFIKLGGGGVVFKPGDQASPGVTEAPALRFGVCVVDEADQPAILVPAALLTVAIQKGPYHAPVVEISLGTVGHAVAAVIEGLAICVGVKFRGCHGRFGPQGGGDKDKAQDRQ